MAIRKTMVLGALFICSAVSAQVKVSATPDKASGLYNTGDKVVWTINATNKDGSPANTDIKYQVKKGGYTTIEQGAITLKDGKATLSASRKDPGSLLLQLNVDGKKSYGGAIFNYSEIKPSSERPADFDEFWKNKIAELKAIPMNVKLEKVDVDKDVDYWKITMDNINGTKIYGQIAKPKNGTDKLPVRLQLQYAGVYGLNKNWVVAPAKRGWLAMNIIAHDIPIDREKEYYTALSKGKLRGYMMIGARDRETSYFLRMYLSCYRAVEYLSQRSDWDGKILHVKGDSQGGLQTIMIAGLNPKVTSIAANVPAGCDTTGLNVGRAPGWPQWHHDKSELSMAASKYFDVVNFASNVTCPALIGVGAIDVTCPPEGVCAMFNQLKGPKRLLVMPVAGHNWRGHQPFRKLEKKWYETFKTGFAMPMAEAK